MIYLRFAAIAYRAFCYKNNINRRDEKKLKFFVKMLKGAQNFIRLFSIYIKVYDSARERLKSYVMGSLRLRSGNEFDQMVIINYIELRITEQDIFQCLA
jgi:hypothetical protein